MPPTASARRPLKVRDAKVMIELAKTLSATPITPNHISLLSVLFAFLAALCFLGIGWGLSPYFTLLAAVLIQLRLLCNLLDGMVAIEGKKLTPAGELFNDIPDRIADPLILVAAGYACTQWHWVTSAGWLAGLLAVMTAYVRVLATSAGAPTRFTGPMAKQQRMALMTGACCAAPVEYHFLTSIDYSLAGALIVIILGCFITLQRRTLAAYRHLAGA